VPIAPFSELRSSGRRITFGLTILSTVFVGAVIGYRLFGYDWVGAVWMTVITISSVGYGERSQGSPAFQLFTVLVILLGISAAAYTFGGLINLMTQGEIERAFKRRRMTIGIDKLSGHVIVCGFGRMGQSLAESLKRRGRSFLILEKDEVRSALAESRGFFVLTGDATDDATLLTAGVKRAKSLVTCLPNDADNVFITLTARNFCPEIQIVARAEQTSSDKKLRQAGANKIVLPTAIGAQQMVRMLTRPSTADLIELLAETTELDVDLDELSVPAGASLVGRKVRHVDPNREYRLLILAVKKGDGKMLFNPDGDYAFEAQDTVIVVGAPDKIEAFRKAQGL
jgi:voltage-gated potassium channel